MARFSVMTFGRTNTLYIAIHRPGMGVGRGDAPLDFEKFSKKTLFSWFRVEKNKSHHFWPPLEKF